MAIERTSSRSANAQLLRRLLLVPESGVALALLCAVMLFVAIEPAFLSERNVAAMLNIVAFVGIIAVGQTLLLVSGEFDLSVGSIAGLSAVAAAKFMTVLLVPVPLALAAGVAVGALIGLVNGLAVVHLRIPAFIQTLGMLFIGQGLIQVVTGGYPVYPLPPAVGAIGAFQIAFGLGYAFLFFLLLALAADFFLRRTVSGRNLYATGGNAVVARLVGINTAAYRIGAFVLVGALAAIAGMFVMADLASATTGIGSGWELTVIAGVVVGGVSLFGGSGTILGAILGVLLLQAIQSGLVVIGVGPNWQQISVGLIMILAVGLDALRQRLSLSGALAEAAAQGRGRPSPRHRAIGAVVGVAALAGLLVYTMRPSPVPLQPARKSMLWVNPLRDHPVSRIWQAGFLAKCRELDMACEIVGNASATKLDVAATIPLAQAAMARRRFDAVAVLSLDTAIHPFIARLAREGVPVVTWHVLPAPGEIPGLRAATGEDVAVAGRDAARAMGARLRGRGVVAVSQGSFNTLENAMAQAFKDEMTRRHPAIAVLAPQLEGFEPADAKGKAIAMLQGNGAITGAFSTTGNGAQTWSGASRSAGRPLVIIGMDYLRHNLDLVRSGAVHGLVAQPLFEEAARATEIGFDLAHGRPAALRNPLPAPVITARDLAPYYAILDEAGQ